MVVIGAEEWNFYRSVVDEPSGQSSVHSFTDSSEPELPPRRSARCIHCSGSRRRYGCIHAVSTGRSSEYLDESVGVTWPLEVVTGMWASESRRPSAARRPSRPVRIPLGAYHPPTLPRPPSPGGSSDRQHEPRFAPLWPVRWQNVVVYGNRDAASSGRSSPMFDRSSNTSQKYLPISSNGNEGSIGPNRRTQCRRRRLGRNVDWDGTSTTGERAPVVDDTVRRDPVPIPPEAFVRAGGRQTCSQRLQIKS